MPRHELAKAIAIISRLHNISKERECLTAHIPCTNALR